MGYRQRTNDLSTLGMRTTVIQDSSTRIRSYGKRASGLGTERAPARLLLHDMVPDQTASVCDPLVGWVISDSILQQLPQESEPSFQRHSNRIKATNVVVYPTR